MPPPWTIKNRPTGKLAMPMAYNTMQCEKIGVKIDKILKMSVLIT